MQAPLLHPGERAAPPSSGPAFIPPFLRIGKLSFLTWRPGPLGGSSPPGGIDLELVKAGHRRGVYRSTIHGRRAVVKISFHPLGRFKLGRERRRLESLRHRGLPAPGVIGWGRPDAGRFALALEEVQGGIFDAAWEAAPDRRARRSLLAALSASVSALHRKGVEHRDPHPRNLLVGPGGSLYWIDAGGLRSRRRPLRGPAALRNLGAIHAAFSAATGAPEREWLRALVLYLGRHPGSGAGREERRLWAREALRLSRRHRLRTLRARAVRCFRENRDFVGDRRPGRRAFARREEAGESWRRLLEDPDSLFEGALILKDGRSTRAARILWNGRPAFLKRYHRPGLLHHLKYLFRRSRAARSWAAGYAFELRSIPAPRPLAVLEKRVAGWPGPSYLVTEWAEGITSDRILHGPEGSGLQGGARTEMARVLGAALARAHDLGAWHRDLKPQNVFFDPRRRTIALVDLDGARIVRRLGRRRRSRDLARWLRDLPEGAGVRAAFIDSYRSCLPARFA